MIYITGDTHRDFTRLHKLKETEKDMLIVLGDAGINYYLNEEDTKYKDYLNSFKIKLFCIRGNHEERPENINTYKEIDMFGRIKIFNKNEYVSKYDRNGYEIIRDYCSQNDINKDGKVVCPKCNSRDIIIQKGDGFNIYG